MSNGGYRHIDIGDDLNIGPTNEPSDKSKPFSLDKIALKDINPPDET